MTAILISRDITEEADTLYLAADQRVTAGDTVISDRNIKIFTYEATEKHLHRRHYITVGDVAPTDYLIHKIEQLDSLDSLYSYMFENEMLSKMPGTLVFYVVDEVPGKPQILQVSKHKKYMGVVNYPLAEILEYPIFDGSGGETVMAAYKALQVHSPLEIESRILASFEVAASIINSINNNVTLVPIVIKKFKKKRVKTDE